MARRTTANLLAATMLGTADSNALVPIIAFYAQHIGADLFTAGIFVGLFSLAHAPANLFFERIADRIGRKLPLEVGLLWDSISLFLYSLASTTLLLALVRISHGIGSGREHPPFDSIARENHGYRSHASCLTAKPPMHHRRVQVWLWRLVAAG